MNLKNFFSIVLLCVCLVFIGCSSDKSAEKKQQEQTDKLMDEVNSQIGMPNIVNFQQKKLMKMIFELCDKEELQCYLYIFSAYLGKFIYIDKCIGYGLPFAAQYTNPLKAKRCDMGSHYNDFVLPQADPNMLYMPTSSSATWLIMKDKKNEKIRVGYWEPEIVVLPFVLDDRLVLNKEMNGK